MRRRDFLKSVGLGAASIAVPGCSRLSEEKDITAVTRESFIKDRKKAAHRIRRIIMNNDGNDLYTADPGAPVTPESFLSKRTIPLIGSHVDSIFYCTGVFNYYTHRSEETELLDDKESAARHIHKLIQQGTDSLEVMTNFCHQHGLEVFWSMRMNDNHDSTTPYLLCQWKKDHPQYLMGTKEQKFPYGCNKWSAVDYTLSDVRDKVFRILKNVATRYDVDGLEYDFFRHPHYFKPQMTGEPVTQEHCDMMTEMASRIREMTKNTAKRRNRPMLIAVRIPDSVGYCKAIGLDVVRWLKEDLIDIITGGGYFKLEPWENLAKLGQQYKVPVYACFVSRRIMEGGEPEVSTSPTALKRWRGEALNAWKAGVNGIYTFNRFNPRDQIFRELGDPELLKTLERIDQTKYAGEKGYLDPGRWLRGGRDFIRIQET